MYEYANVCHDHDVIRRPVAKNESFSYRSSYRNFSYPLKFLLDADIAIVHAQRIRDRQDDSDRLPLSMDNSESCERRSSVSKCTPEWDERLSFLATGCHMHTSYMNVCKYVMYDVCECAAFKINQLCPLRVSEKSIVSCAFARGLGAGRCWCWCAPTAM